MIRAGTIYPSPDYTVYCHGNHRDEGTTDDPYGFEASAHKRSKSRMIGSPDFGALWHCPKHYDCPSCPRGEWTDPMPKEATT
jgi:hypothetical protein